MMKEFHHLSFRIALAALSVDVVASFVPFLLLCSLPTNETSLQRPQGASSIFAALTLFTALTRSFPYNK